MKERYGRDFEGVTTLGRYKVLYKLLNERIEIASDLNKHMTKLYSNTSCIRTAKDKQEDIIHELAIPECQEKLKIKSKSRYLISCRPADSSRS